MKRIKKDKLEKDKTQLKKENMTLNNLGEKIQQENLADNTTSSIDEKEKMENEKTETINDIQLELDKLKQVYETELNEWKDKYIRLSAEFDNYRKRTLKERMELTKYASEDVLKNILPIVDDFERGIKNIEQASDIDALKEGIFLIYNKFRDFLSQNGIKEIEIKDNEFNTDYHEAITKIPVDDKNMSGKIVDVVQKGYLLNDKVIRFSKVVVGE